MSWLGRRLLTADTLIQGSEEKVRSFVKSLKRGWLSRRERGLEFAQWSCRRNGEGSHTGVWPRSSRRRLPLKSDVTKKCLVKPRRKNERASPLAWSAPESSEARPGWQCTEAGPGPAGGEQRRRGHPAAPGKHCPARRACSGAGVPWVGGSPNVSHFSTTG